MILLEEIINMFGISKKAENPFKLFNISIDETPGCKSEYKAIKNLEELEKLTIQLPEYDWLLFYSDWGGCFDFDRIGNLWIYKPGNNIKNIFFDYNFKGGMPKC